MFVDPMTVQPVELIVAMSLGRRTFPTCWIDISAASK